MSAAEVYLSRPDLMANGKWQMANGKWQMVMGD
jgi:hypothetical protein